MRLRLMVAALLIPAAASAQTVQGRGGWIQYVASSSGASSLPLAGGTPADTGLARVSAGLVKITDGGAGNGQLQTSVPLTAGTMTVEVESQARNVVSSYTWTNAMVVALGASTTGDITVATLPAKTEVLDAQVVILTRESALTSLTVACGRTSAAYIDYIVASNAKVGPNTLYGAVNTDRGTNLTGYDVPSYTGTTAVKCHFVSGVENLSTALASTGRVILTTKLLP